MAGLLLALGHGPLVAQAFRSVDAAPLGLAAATLAAFAILDRVSRALLRTVSDAL